jgi:hypothetical protein
VTENTAQRGSGGAFGQAIAGGIYIADITQAILDEFTVAHITSNTASTNFPDIRGSYEIIPHANPAAGDFNDNGTVDAADYVVWRKGLGTFYTQNDYNVWRAHFGQTASGGVSAGAIVAAPEPTTIMMLAVATITCWIASGRRHHNLTMN